MTGLKELKWYWDEMVSRIPDITGAMAVTVDENMARRIQSLQLGTTTLFWLPPKGTGQGTNVDNYRDKELCVVFVMEKYDPSREDCIDVLGRTQQAIERVKALLLDSQRCGCSPVRLADMQIDTVAETKFFAGFAGWSIAFSTVDGLQVDARKGRIFSDVFSKQFN